MTADERSASSWSPGDEPEKGPSSVRPQGQTSGGWDPTRSAVDAYDAELLSRHADLVAVDNVIGLEATVARLEYDLRRVRTRVKRLQERLEAREEELAAMRSSRTWKVGRMFTRPLGRIKG